MFNKALVKPTKHPPPLHYAISNFTKMDREGVQKTVTKVLDQFDLGFGE